MIAECEMQIVECRICSAGAVPRWRGLGVEIPRLVRVQVCNLNLVVDTRLNSHSARKYINLQG